ncbi:MAG TPA: hypothetical protein VLQ89_02360, partial [Candidatus Binatia bacterium]|nr:hypothetical protein [Candidatus Binatia bacterium]
MFSYIPILERTFVLVIGILNLEFIWNLGFGAWNLSSYMSRVTRYVFRFIPCFWAKSGVQSYILLRKINESQNIPDPATYAVAFRGPAARHPQP